MECKKLGEIAIAIFSGGTPNTKKDEYWNGYINWLSSGETRNRFITETEKKITVQGVEGSSTKLAKSNDIVIASAGQGHTRGQTSYCLIDTYINQSVIAIRADEKKVLPLFLFYNLSARYNELRAISDSHSSRGSLTTKLLNDLPVYLPSLSQQEKITKILYALDEKININHNIINSLEQLAQTLFKHWFVDFEFPNENGEPYKSSGGEMVESELGRIPMGWDIRKIGEVTKIVRGASPRPIKDYIKSFGMPWVKISDANASKSMYINSTREFIKKEGISKSRVVTPGTLILSNSATPGIPKFMAIEACVHDGWLIFDEYLSITKEFLYLYLLRERESILNLSNGSVFRNLKTDILKNYKIVIPDEKTISAFQEVLTSLFLNIKFKSVESIRLEELRDTLLPKLLSGEIELPDETEVTEHVSVS